MCCHDMQSIFGLHADNLTFPTPSLKIFTFFILDEIHEMMAFLLTDGLSVGLYRGHHETPFHYEESEQRFLEISITIIIHFYHECYKL